MGRFSAIRQLGRPSTAKRPNEIPIPPLEMRTLVAQVDPSFYDNPTGSPVFPSVPVENYSSVFDFGCGCGRIARQLIQQDPRPQRYLGIDLHLGMIEWCKANLEPFAEGFEFRHHDVLYAAFNPGAEKPSVLPLPAGDNMFTLVVAHSVFTHLLEDQAKHYLAEASRILRPDGLLLSTWFLFDKGGYPMMQDSQNALFINAADPANAVIFDREWLRQTARELGLAICRVEAPGVRGYQWTVTMAPLASGVAEVDFPADDSPIGVRRPPVVPPDADKIRPRSGLMQPASKRKHDPSKLASSISEAELRRRIESVPHWYHRIELAPGIVTPGVNDSPAFLRALEELGLPQDCSGMRVLDVGARDGYFSFELERRGAEVTAFDYAPPETTGFLVARELVDSQVEYRVGNVYDLDPATFGKFDCVLFLGVLYHLRNPLLALDSIWSVCADRVWIESYAIDHGFVESESGDLMSLSEVAPRIANEPIMQFFPRDALNGDYSNWWGPNMACLKEMAAMANFSVEKEMVLGSRGLVACRVTNDPEVEQQRRIERSTMT